MTTFSVDTAVIEAIVFATVRQFKPSLILGGKDNNLPWYMNHTRDSTQVGSCLACKYRDVPNTLAYYDKESRETVNCFIVQSSVLVCIQDNTCCFICIFLISLLSCLKVP